MKRTQGSKTAVATILLMAMVLIGSGAVFAGGGGEQGAAGKSFKVGLVVPTLNIFYNPLADAVVKAVKAAGGTAIVTDAEQYKVAKELANVENLLQQKIDVLIIDASDKVASSPAVEAANKAGVPVIGLNNETAAGNFITVVASDNYKAGKLAAEFVMEQIGNKGKIAIIDGPPVPAVMDRIQAYKDAIFANKDTKIVALQLMGNTLAEGVSVAENILQANPDLDAFLCMNDFAFLGAYNAIQNAGKLGEIAIGSVDAAPDAVQLLAEGRAPKCATAAQFPSEIGNGAVQAYLDYRAGKKVAKRIYVKVELITKENATGFHW
jgi:ribose transport system substrate-binding protein